MSGQRRIRLDVDLTFRLAEPLEVSFRPAKEVEELQARVASLESQLGHMSLYANMSLRLTDELREAKARLEALGEDTSFIHLR